MLKLICKDVRHMHERKSDASEVIALLFLNRADCSLNAAYQYSSSSSSSSCHLMRHNSLKLTRSSRENQMKIGTGFYCATYKFMLL